MHITKLPFGFAQIDSMHATLVICVIALFIFSIVSCYWKLFIKAGQPGWAAILPIYNVVVMLRIIKEPWWWILLLCIPGLDLIIGIIISYNFAKSFGRSHWFAIGTIVLPFICIPIMAFSNNIIYDPDYKYVKVDLENESNHPSDEPH